MRVTNFPWKIRILDYNPITIFLVHICENAYSCHPMMNFLAVYIEEWRGSHVGLLLMTALIKKG